MFIGFPRGISRCIVPSHAPSLRAHAIATQAAPAKLDRSALPMRPQMCFNNVYGTCVPAALVNAIHAQAVLQHSERLIPDQAALTLYSETTPFNPNASLVGGQNPTDQGTDPVALLDYQVQSGFRWDGCDEMFVGLWASIDPGDLNLMRVCLAELGCVMAVVNLSESDTMGGDAWRLNPPASYGNPAPGSAGMHGVCFWDYGGVTDDDTARIATWGTLMPATWPWVRSRLVALFPIWHRQLLGPGQVGPSGVNVERLAADVAGFEVAT